MQTTNNTILITGGSTGIGLALAETFIREGNVVLICGRRETKLLPQTWNGLFCPVCSTTLLPKAEEIFFW